jgi:pimeloyl-ACP methyl ester carboxylesterase
MKSMLTGLLLAAAMFVGTNASAQTSMHKPTIVLAHGAFADASSWNGVIKVLRKDGYFVIAAANPLRGVGSDSAYIGSLVGDLKDPVVLVGHWRQCHHPSGQWPRERQGTGIRERICA